jgi:colanic acid/amylovoran biosynthesis glycosyltransferase
VAYLVNQYPAVSHTFIRREIEALERLGAVVQRIALRGWDVVVVDAADKSEQTKTHYVLQRGVAALLVALVRQLLRSPRLTLRALRLAADMSRSSDRSTAVHLAYLAEACVVRRLLDAVPASHLHAHFATNPAEIAMLTHALGGPPYSFTAHGSDITDRPAQIGLPLTVRAAEFVIAVSSFGRGQMFKWLPHDLWPRVHVVRCGLRRDFAAGIAMPSGSRRLLCIGRLSREKGQLLLVQAAKLLCDAGEVVEIVLAGDGPMRAEVDATIATLGLAGRVRITGWLDSEGIRGELAAASVLVVPSLSEGLPVVIMEAMAASRPVIAPYLAGIPELVVNGRNGWLFPVGDVAALAAAIRAFIRAPEAELARMGTAACSDVWAAHDVDANAQALLDLMRRASPASRRQDETTR